jgi:hypothetical protein
MTGAEQFWYVLTCIPFGAGYFGKIPVAKALSELPQYRAQVEANLGTLSYGSSPPPPPSVAPGLAPAAELGEQSLQVPEAEPAPRHQHHNPDEQSEPPESGMPS